MASAGGSRGRSLFSVLFRWVWNTESFISVATVWRIIMRSHCDVIVAGAGIVGLSVAYRLAQRGAQVTVLDPDQKGGRGSRAAAGVVIPSIRTGSDQALHDFARQGLHALDAELKRLAPTYAIEQ